MNTGLFSRRLLSLAAIALLTSYASALNFEIPKDLQNDAAAQKAAEDAETQQAVEDLYGGKNEAAESEAMSFGSGDGSEATENEPEAETVDESSFLEFDPNSPTGTALGEQGIVTGQIFDKDTSQPLSGVAILIEGTDIGSITDGNGNYTLGPAPAGTYTLNFLKTGYIEANVTEFEVVAGESKEFGFALPPRPAEMSDEVYELQDFVVTADEAGNQMQQFIELRQAAVGSVDFLSAEDMARYGDSDIASLIKRIPGVNVVEGKFAVVRGLSDRYNSTLVNGLPMPSPDPLRQGLQLDLFPSSIIETVVTNKMFTPNLPGNSGGGSFELTPKAFSDEWYGHIKFGVERNENVEDEFLESPELSTDDLLFNGTSNRRTTFYKSGSAVLDGVRRDEYSYRDSISPFIGKSGSPLETVNFEFGFGGGVNLEKYFPGKLRFVLEGSYESQAETKKGTEPFQNKFPKNSFNTGLVFNLGQASEIPSFFTGGPLFIGGFPTGQVPSSASGLVSDEYPNNLSALFIPGSLSPDSDDPNPLSGGTAYDLTESIMTVSGGLLFGTQLALGEDENHLLTFSSLSSRLTQDTVTRLSNGRVIPGGSLGDAPGGPDVSIGEDGTTVTLETIDFEERELQSFNLTGLSVDDKDAPNWEFGWGLGTAETTSETPHRSDVWYLEQDGNYFLEGASLTSSPPFIKESSSFIEQTTDSYRADIGRYFETFLDKERRGKLTVGIYSDESERDVEGRNAAYIAEPFTELLSRDDLQAFMAALEKLPFDNPLFFSVNGDQSIKIADDGTLTFLDNGTFPTEAKVSQDISDQYLMLELPFADRFKISGGARFSDVSMDASGTSTLAGNDGVTDVGVGGNTLGVILNQQYPTPGDGGDPITNADILNWQDVDVPAGSIDEDYILPSIILQFDATDYLTFRAGYSETYALPSFRELSPYFDFEGTTGDIVLGNPYLEPSDVESFDIRADVTLEDGSYFSISYFVKTIRSPIERVKLLDGSGGFVTSYFNNPNDAELDGFELEARTNLGFLEKIHESLAFMKNVSVGGNYTYIDAEVEQPENVLSTYTADVSNGGEPISFGPYATGAPPSSRRLFDQPEWLVNADVSVEVPATGTTVSFIVFGQSDVLTSVGTGNAVANGISRLDEYTDEYFDLKMRIQQKLFDDRLKISFSAKNLTDSERKVIYDPEVVDDQTRYSYKLGRTYSLSVEWFF